MPSAPLRGPPPAWQRVLLHLRAYQQTALEDVVAPATLSQEGIAAAVGVSRSNLSPVLQELEERGFTESAKRHFKGARSVKSAYWLTPAGLAKAQELTEELEAAPVVAIDLSGAARETTVGAARSLLPRPVSLTDLLLAVEQGKVDCRKLQEELTRRDRRFIDYTERELKLRHFYGRPKELEALRGFLASPVARLCVLWGLPGIGKSTLAWKLIEEVRGSRHCVWLRLQEWLSPAGLARALGEALARAGRPQLARALEQEGGPDDEMLHRLFRETLEGLPMLIVIDDLHRASEGVVAIVALLVDAVEALEGPKLLITSRVQPSFYDRRKVAPEGIVVELPVGALDLPSAEALLRERHIPPEHWTRLYQLTGGHPLALELVLPSQERMTHDLARFLQDEVAASLTPLERWLVHIASVLRYPVLPDGLLVVDQYLRAQDSPFLRLPERGALGDFSESVRSLIGRGLFSEYLLGTLLLHDAVRSYFYSSLGPEERSLLHRGAAELYLEEHSAPAAQEALHHFCAAEAFAEAAEVATSWGHVVLERGGAETLVQLVPRLLEAHAVPSELKPSLGLLLGEARLLLGQWSSARETLTGLVSGAAAASSERVRAAAHRELAALAVRTHEYAVAEPHILEGLDLAAATGNLALEAQLHYDRGGIAERQGQLDEAKGAFEAARRCAEEAGDPRLEALALYGLGRVADGALRFGEARTLKEEALARLASTGDLSTQAKVLTGLGLSRWQLDDYDGALAAHREARAAAAECGDQLTLAYALTNGAAAQLRLGLLDEAERALVEAKPLVQRLPDWWLGSMWHLFWGQLRAERGDWTGAAGAFAISEPLARQSLRGPDLVQWLLTVGKLEARHGLQAEGMARLEEAEKLAASLQLDGLQRAVAEAHLMVGDRRRS